jgi:hypothetical protein
MVIISKFPLVCRVLSESPWSIFGAHYLLPVINFQHAATAINDDGFLGVNSVHRNSLLPSGVLPKDVAKNLGVSIPIL